MILILITKTDWSSSVHSIYEFLRNFTSCKTNKSRPNWMPCRHRISMHVCINVSPGVWMTLYLSHLFIRQLRIIHVSLNSMENYQQSIKIMFLAKPNTLLIKFRLWYLVTYICTYYHLLIYEFIISRITISNIFYYLPYCACW